ncbi:MAG TPA: inositol monophosphatase family protein [Anaerolineae bacterium]|nr:inositol monophosphatase family protein [Anaerolineae bacterium]
MERVSGSDELICAVEVAQKAARLLRDLFEREHSVRTKSSASDLVTEADTGSEALIVESLRARFPRIPILSEEGLGDLAALSEDEDGADGAVAGAPASGLWIVDPLDGTVNYAHRYPSWGVSISLAVGGRVQVAATCDPMRGQTYWAERGRGAWCDGRRMQVSRVARLGESLLMTGFPYSREAGEDNNLVEFSALMPQVHAVRRAGAAVLDMAHVADGRLDGYWEKHLRPWDWAAGWLLVEEAGGTVTRIDGLPWSLVSGTLVASNGLIHAELLQALQAAHLRP